jgi:hypothetical protein
MEDIILRAHFDGSQILLDDPFELKPNTKLLIKVISPEQEEVESWYDLSMNGLGAAYGNDEPEYPVSLIKEYNAYYERG